jgi:predicted choloylglycine hydrolase
MKNIYSAILQFRGTHYDFGFMQGELLKDSLLLKNREQQWKVRKPRFTIDEQEAKRAITMFSKGVWEELEGLQNALKWPMKKILQEFGGYRLDYVRSGCSIVTGHNYFVRNYDYHPKTYEGRYCLFQPSDKGYAFIGPSQRITGRPDGMNEKGLVIGYNFMNRKRPGAGFICCMIGRFLLETCANVEEAVALLKEIPHRHSFSYIVYDKSGQTYIVEASPRGVEIRQATICTNHFEIMQDENRNHLVDSKRRIDIIQNRQPELTGVRDAFRLMNDSDKGIFSDEYQNWAGTIHTSAYLPQEMKAWFALGGDQEPTEFDFGKWLSGEDLPSKIITGQVNTDIPFAHMDEGADWFR